MVPRPELAARLIACVAALSLLGTPVLFAQDRLPKNAFDNLVAAYPSPLASHGEAMLHWRDGTVMPLSDGAENKSFDALLRHASIADQLRLPYPRGPLSHLPQPMPIRAVSVTPRSSQRCMAIAGTVR